MSMILPLANHPMVIKDDRESCFAQVKGGGPLEVENRYIVPGIVLTKWHCI